MKKAAHVISLTLAILSLAALTPSLMAGSLHSGIHVRVSVMVGDVMFPVEVPFRVFYEHSGREIGQFDIPEGGVGSVLLPRGRYLIVPYILMIGSFGQLYVANSFEVTIGDRKFTNALIVYHQDDSVSLGNDK